MAQRRVVAARKEASWRWRITGWDRWHPVVVVDVLPGLLVDLAFRVRELSNDA